MSQNRVESGSPVRWVPTLYFAEGLPFVAIATVSTLMYKGLGVSDAQIAFWTSLVMLPWTLKPLWGPLLEMFRTKKWFVVLTQSVIGVCFALLAFSLPLSAFFQYSLALFAIIAFNGATHDIAADGLYISVLSEKRQSEFVGWQGASYNTAKIFTQGLLVYIAGQLETSVGVVNAWMIVMGVFGTIMLILSLYHSRFLPAGADAGVRPTVTEAARTVRDVIRTFFTKKHVWAGIAFIILYRFAEGQAVKIVPLFMKAAREQGGLALSTSEIGIIYGTFGVAAFVLGSILAGYFTARRGLRRSLMILCAFFNIPFAVYAFLAIMQPTDLLAIGAAVVFEYFGYGFGFVGLTLFMMQQIAPGKYRTAHYAFATGIMSLGMMIPSMLSGFISDWLGYREFFIWVVIATIPSFVVTWLVPFRDVAAEEGTAAGEV